jgi:signal transduction histidine kinase
VGVKDYGIGIAPEKLNHIFTRYYRVDNGKAKASGLGIGLYLCHEIITRHKGKIWAESEPGKGSTFWFTLPC